MVTKDESKWNPVKLYIDHCYKVSNGGDHIGAGCSNIAKAIVLGLKYIGDCILDAKKTS